MPVDLLISFGRLAWFYRCVCQMLLLLLFIDKLLLLHIKLVDNLLFFAILVVEFINYVGLSSDFCIQVFWCLLLEPPIIQYTVLTLLQLWYILLELVINLLLIIDVSTCASRLLKQEHYYKKIKEMQKLLTWKFDHSLVFLELPLNLLCK